MILKSKALLATESVENSTLKKIDGEKIHRSSSLAKNFVIFCRQIFYRKGITTLTFPNRWKVWPNPNRFHRLHTHNILY